MKTIKILEQKPIQFPTWILNRYTIFAPKPFISFKCPIGIDPGTSHLGIAQLDPDDEDKAVLWQITMERSDNALFRIMMVSTVLRQIFGKPNADPKQIVIIEGASFGNNFRQAELAEQRTAMALWFIPMTYYGSRQIKFVPPTTIRKVVFGSGKIKAHEAWQLEGIPKSKQPNDALAALSCAYYGMMKEGE